MPNEIWKPKGVMYFLSAIVAVVAGLYLLVAFSQIWFVGAILLVAGLVYLALAYRNKEKVSEEHEKPLMEISAKSHTQDNGEEAA